MSTELTPSEFKNARNSKLVLVVAVAVMLLFFSTIFWFNNVSRSEPVTSVNKTIKITGIDDIKTILKYFPNFGEILIRPDSVDTNYLWVLSRAGVMRINIHSKEVVDYTEEISIVKNKTLTDLVHVKDFIFISFQGGLIQYDLKTKEIKQYSTADGLVSNSNILIKVDPVDADVLWLSTFEGLGKFTISSSVFKSFKSEIGIPGTALQPKVFQVDDRYVWLTIGANAYTSGGVARLDKSTGFWKSWGNEFFHYGRSSSRFDTYGAAADKENAVVEDDGILYSYNSTKDEWSPVTEYNKNSPVKKIIYLKGSNVYFVSDTLKEFNVETKIERNFFTPGMFLNTGISFTDFIKNIDNIVFDAVNNRFIIYPSVLSTNQGIDIFSLENNTFYTFSFKIFEEKFKLFNATIADANNNHLILNTNNKLVDYNVSKDIVNELLPRAVSVAKIIDNKIIALNLDMCEMSCNPKTLVSTSTIISLETNKTESVATINGAIIGNYHIGSTTDDIYLFGYDYKEKMKGYKVDVVSNKINLVDFNFPHTWEPQSIYSNLENHVSESSLDNSYKISFNSFQVGDGIDFNIENSDSKKSLKVFVGPARYNHWTTNTEVSVYSHAFDASDQYLFWIGTNRGLIRINLKTLEYKLFTTKDGLFSDQISKIISFSQDLVAVEHEGGVYIYNLKNKK